MKAIRRASLIVHGLLSIPALLLVGFALLAIVLSITGANSDPHGFATAFALVGGAIGIVPLLVYLWLIRRWWTGRSPIALALADIGLIAFAVALLVYDYAPGEPWVAALYGALAASGVLLLWSEARGARVSSRPAS